MDIKTILTLLQKIVKGMSKEQFLALCGMIYDLVTANKE